MWQEFKTFVARGNMFDLAVGIVIGASFTTVVNSFVKDLLMPPIGVLTRGIDFAELYINLSDQGYPSLAAATQAGAPTINVGVFLNNLLSFLIVGVAVFLLVRGYNRLRAREAETPAPAERECPYCRLGVAPAATRCPHCTSDLATAA